ncbi:uncharacterized protein LOC108739742 isoform X2 [Agrilus planipennis]|uniref:Uncharacterized protein LOC108739742 isoform X2 n=1 Tax=Agrilus planipennis TaxID=224129 RepID=A0A1W4X8Y7_AGRPL|nr:uncharacterized protein LOC108739742 isoform X2 [Agrilus planipennis]
MPPVRWRLLIIIVSMLTYLETTKSQEFISMTADGWKPIVGKGGPRHAIVQDEITQYRNPSELAANNIHALGKNTIKLRISPGHPSSSHRPPSSNKHSTGGQKKLSKPARSPVGAYSIKNEVYLPAPPSALGSYVYFNSGRNNQKVRDIPVKHVHNQGVNNPHQYTSFFTLPGLPSPRPTPAQNFIFPNKQHVQNDVNYYANHQQNDEYSKNLVPPPPETQVDVKEQKLIGHQSPIHLPENLVVQVPPPFNIQNSYVHNIPGQQGVEVTKENFNVFRNNVPHNYHETNVNQYQQQVIPDQYQKYNQKTKDHFANPHTYEVTEGTYWESHLSTARNPHKDPALTFNHFRRPLLPAEDPTIKTFLPTPLKSDPLPTVASQSDVSAVYTELNLKNRQKERPNGSFFNIKEVSTHYPILGNPVAPNEPENSDLTNEITTKEELPEKTVLTPTKTAYADWQNSGQEPQASRPHRRRRPTRPKISTSPSTFSTTPEGITETYHETSTHKRRRVIKHRLTTTTELPAANPSNNNFAESSEQKENSFINSENNQKKPEFEKEETQHSSEVTSSTSPLGNYSSDDYANTNPETYTDVYDISKEKVQQPKLKKRKRIHPTTSLPKELETTEAPIVETEHSYSYETTAEETQQTEDELSTTLATTSTTTESTTLKTSRVKARPLKNKTRPRFSVKDYRQRLNQYSTSSSSTTSSTTEASRIRDSSNRLRFPHRVRKPVASNNKDESTTSEPSRFTPKEPRFTTTEIDSYTIATEKPVKAVNTRLRPFGRYRSTSTTTEPSTTQHTQKGSVKPSIFASGRRPVYPSLKTRIMGKYNRTQSTTSEKPSEYDSGEMEEEDVSDEVQAPGMITAKMDTYEASEEVKKANKLDFKGDDGGEDSTTPQSASDSEYYDSDAEQDESTIQQRISDLTSSSDNKYNTPGMFKSVSATSRIIPSHFTISTEDPVLPIETFFSNFKEAPK